MRGKHSDAREAGSALVESACLRGTSGILRRARRLARTAAASAAYGRIQGVRTKSAHAVTKASVASINRRRSACR